MFVRICTKYNEVKVSLVFTWAGLSVIAAVSSVVKGIIQERVEGISMVMLKHGGILKH